MANLIKVKCDDRVTDEMVKELAARLRDDDRGVRRAAVEVLAAFKDRVTDEMVKELAARLRDDEWGVHEAAYRTLKIIYESGIPLPLEKSL